MRDLHSEIGPVTEDMVRRLNAGEIEAFNDIYHATFVYLCCLSSITSTNGTKPPVLSMTCSLLFGNDGKKFSFLHFLGFERPSKTQVSAIYVLPYLKKRH